MTWPAGQGSRRPGQFADHGAAAPGSARYYEPVALVDVLDRVLGTGVVIAGEVTLSIAGVDLVVVSLRALVASAAALAGAPAGAEEELAHERV